VVGTALGAAVGLGRGVAGGGVVGAAVGLGRGVAGGGVAVGARVGVGAGVAVAVCAVRFSSVKAPCRLCVVWVARAEPTLNATDAPSVPQPDCDAAEATSMTKVPVPLTWAVPQVLEPTVAVTFVPEGAGWPFNCAVP
jgi:hypothetical protein